MNRAVQTDDPFTNFGAAEAVLLRQVQLAGTYLAKAIGGYSISKHHRGDSQPTVPPVLAVDVSLQRTALQAIASLLSDSNAVDRDPQTSWNVFPAASSLPYLVRQSGTCEGLGAPLDHFKHFFLLCIFLSTPTQQRIPFSEHNYPFISQSNTAWGSHHLMFWKPLITFELAY
jgi:hypothetical protein